MDKQSQETQSQLYEANLIADFKKTGTLPRVNEGEMRDSLLSPVPNGQPKETLEVFKQLSQELLDRSSIDMDNNQNDQSPKSFQPVSKRASGMTEGERYNKDSTGTIFMIAKPNQ